MDREIIPQSPRACCYKCHSPIIDKVCHHCGKALCKNHKSEFVFLNPEFTRLLLNDRTVHNRKRVVHCRDCVAKIHHQRLRWRYLSWLLPLNWIHAKYLSNDRPLLPTVPGLSTISIREKIHGHITLNTDGIYSEEVTLPPQGIVEIAVKFNEPDRERISVYRRKYRIKTQKNLPFHAGFIVMQQTSNVQFVSFLKEDLLQPDTFILRSTVAEQPFLAQSSADKQADVWKQEFPYTIARADEKTIPLPIQLVPILIRDDAVALIVQTRPGIAELVKVQSSQIDKLAVFASPHLDKVTFTNPLARIHELNISWMKPESDSNQQTKTADSAEDESESKWQESRSHYIRFANPIHLGENHATLTGKLTMVLEGTLSGMETPLLFFPWGEKRDGDEVAKKSKFKTEVELRFDLDLSSLRCPTRYPEQAETELSITRYPGAMLTHQMVTRLTHRLNETGAYVKRIVENPARTDKANANITNHFWDIAGRYYKGIFPINFHLVLTGKQEREAGQACSVVAELYVHGFVTNEKMQTQIDEVQAELQKVVKEILEDYIHSSNVEHSMNGFSSTGEVIDRERASQLVEQISDLLNQLGNVLRDD